MVRIATQLRRRPSAMRPPVLEALLDFSPALMPAAVVSEVIALPPLS
jgi:hypothetical protein